MNLIISAGDSFIDNWIFVSPEKKRFRYEFCISKLGGQARVFETLQKSFADFQKSFDVIDYDFSTSVIERYMSNNKVLFELEREEPNFNLSTFETSFTKKFLDSYNYKAIVISDYNRSEIVVSGQYDLLLVDSKYQTFNFNKDNFKLKIWRCTEAEFDQDYADNFDYAIITNHESRKILLNKVVNNKYLTIDTEEQMFEKQFTELESIGAGDFFIAHLAFFLTTKNVNKADTRKIIEAINFAVSKTQSSLAQQTYDIFLS